MAQQGNTQGAAPSAAPPLYDLFFDLPHPAASPKCPPHFVIGPPPDHQTRADPLIIKELGDDRGIARIARFAFPEHDDRSYAQEVASKQPKRDAERALGGGGSGLNRFDICPHNFPGFMHHTFALQLSNGARVHGHVRRYLPHHLESRTRYDVGRRGVRALVILSRSAGGEKFFASVLKSVEAIAAQQVATPTDRHPSKAPQQAFLFALYTEHLRLCSAYNPQEEKSAPPVASIAGIELGNRPLFLPVDGSRFLFPMTLLRGRTETNAIASSSHLLPLLRCLGVSHTLRLLSALLCERRIILVSQSAARLSACGQAAISMLAQGLLSWQHLYVPVLPPGLLTYLAAPMPYLLGIASNLLPMVDRVPGLGEVLVVNLDANALDTRGMQAATAGSKIPDLLRGSMMMADNGTRFVSISEILGDDLNDVIKVDKRIMAGEVAMQERLGAAAGKATGAMKNAFGKLRDRTKQYVQKQSSSEVDKEPHGEEDKEDPPGEVVPAGIEDYCFGEGFENEVAEEEARIAFTSFFLCFLGDMRWYLSQKSKGGPPEIDREKYMLQRRKDGDGPGSPMFPLLTYFIQTQIFEQFVRSRIEEVKLRAPVEKDAPLFLLCTNYHRVHKMDFSTLNVRRVARQLAPTNPSRFLLHGNEKARRVAMALTSNKAFDGNPQDALAKLTEACREATVLFDIMGVVWMRIRDCRGMQWKHALHALQVLRNLILHGPLAAVSEATDGLEKIRSLKLYSHNMRSQHCSQIRSMAYEVYTLLVDRGRLFSMRRTCANARRLKQSPPQPRLAKDKRMKLSSFKNNHVLLQPAQSAPTMDLLRKSSALSDPQVPQQSVAIPAPTTTIMPNVAQVPQPSVATNMAPVRAAEKPKPPTYGADLLVFGAPAPADAPVSLIDAPVKTQENDPYNMADLFTATEPVLVPQPVPKETPSSQTGLPGVVGQPPSGAQGAYGQPPLPHPGTPIGRGSLTSPATHPPPQGNQMVPRPPQPQPNQPVPMTAYQHAPGSQTPSTQPSLGQPFQAGMHTQTTGQQPQTSQPQPGHYAGGFPGSTYQQPAVQQPNPGLFVPQQPQMATQPPKTSFGAPNSQTGNPQHAKPSFSMFDPLAGK